MHSCILQKRGKVILGRGFHKIQAVSNKFYHQEENFMLGKNIWTALTLLRIAFLATGIICMPFALAVAQTSDTQQTEEEKKAEQEKEKKETEKKEAEGLEERLEEEVTVTGTRVEGRVAT